MAMVYINCLCSSWHAGTLSPNTSRTPGHDGCENEAIVASHLGMVGIPDCDDALEYHYAECSLLHMIRFEPVLSLASEI